MLSTKGLTAEQLHQVQDLKFHLLLTRICFFVVFICLMIETYYFVKQQNITTILWELSDKQRELIHLQKERIKVLESMKPVTLDTQKFNISAYTRSEDECHGDPCVGALTTKIIPGRSVAVSRDMYHLLGQTVYIENIGVRRVEDLMGPQHKKSIDILMETKEDAKKFGRQELKVAVINPHLIKKEDS